MGWKYNPKTYGSGIITCIPQKGECPNKCEDCFFQSGRSYLEPLSENLPHIPSKAIAKGRIVRMNDGNDSNVERELVESAAKQYDDYFFNTVIPDDLSGFSAPVVLTVNPGAMTNVNYSKLALIPKNLMFVRVRVNSWNLKVVDDAVEYYCNGDVPVVLTFMAYYTSIIPENHKKNYTWMKRTLNDYWVLKAEIWQEIVDRYTTKARVYTCGQKFTTKCAYCGNCLREYYATKERMRSNHD